MPTRLGFVKLRRGFFDHTADGRMSWQDGFLYLELLQLADPGTGILRANAPQLAYETHSTPRKVNKYLNRLERKGYIKRFAVRGSPISYPILINRFFCSNSPNFGKVLNATKTTDWRAPIYEQGETQGEGVGEGVGEAELHKERARGDLRLENKNKSKSRPPTPRAFHKPLRTEHEQRRIVEAQQARIRNEAQGQTTARVGEGPAVHPSNRTGVCCIQCQAQLTILQLNRCLSGKGPWGSQTYCPRNPAPVSNPTQKQNPPLVQNSH